MFKLKILDWSDLKCLHLTCSMWINDFLFVCEREENIVAKGENAGYQHFLLLPQCFQRAISLWPVRSSVGLHNGLDISRLLV